jgi:hypothetical protein
MENGRGKGGGEGKGEEEGKEVEKGEGGRKRKEGGGEGEGQGFVPEWGKGKVATLAEGGADFGGHCWSGVCMEGVRRIVTLFDVRGVSLGVKGGGVAMDRACMTLY